MDEATEDQPIFPEYVIREATEDPTHEHTFMSSLVTRFTVAIGLIIIVLGTLVVGLWLSLEGQDVPDATWSIGTTAVGALAMRGGLNTHKGEG